MLNNFFDPQTVDVFIKLFIAMSLGMIIGVERLFAHKTASMRTYALISMGSALFVVISVIVSKQYIGIVNFDPLRLAAQIVAGAGFLGAGLVMIKDREVTGITSSTGLWVSAAIGMGVGFGLYKVSVIATFLVLFIFIILWFIEQRLKNLSFFKNSNIEENR